MSLESRVARLVAVHGDGDALSITELYKQVDRALRTSFPQELWITGEIRSIKVLPKGHCFIDLVDPTHARDNAAPTLGVKCWSTVWRRVAATLEGLGITLDAGMVVRARGQVQFYKARGTVDFVLSELDTDALLGRVAAERVRLIKALVDEDLYDRQRRLPFPTVPLRVGLVASPNTEGFNDFTGGLHKSGMAFEVTVAPTAVQGRVAPSRVAAAIADLQSEPLDLIVVVRGEDQRPIWPHSMPSRWPGLSLLPLFRCGRASDTPATWPWQTRWPTGPSLLQPSVVRSWPDQSGTSGGRVSMPVSLRDGWPANGWRPPSGRSTGIATIRSLVPRSQLDRHGERLVHRSYTLRAAARGHLDGHHRQTRRQIEDLVKSARRSVAGGQERMTDRTRRLVLLSGRRLEVEDVRLGQWRRLLGAYDYRRQLERGYSVTRDADGTVIRSTHDVEPGAVLFTHVVDGEVVSTVADPLAHTPAAGGEEGATRPAGAYGDEDEGNT